jgi:hypothetical protein
MRAILELELRDRHGTLLAQRRASNAVMRGGAVLVAQLFSGKGVAPITHMGVGTSDAEPDAFTTTELHNDSVGGQAALTGDTEVELPDGTFNDPIVDETKRVARVRFHATMPDSAAVGTVREAGLLSRGGGDPVLYNRVIFAPVQKGADHELTLFWEVAFPYGDLQWLQ